MATTKGKKTATTKAATSKTKKSATQEQIEKLEKALGEVKQEDVVSLVPEEMKEQVEADMKAVDGFETPKEVDVEAEVQKIMETAEPSEDVKAQVEEFESTKKEFEEKIEKEPENTEKHLLDEIARLKALVKKAEAKKSEIQTNRKAINDEGFTNWWNGSSGLY